MSSASLQPVPGPARRTVIAAAGAAGLAASLTACGSEDDSSSPTAPEQGKAAPGPADAGGIPLAKTSDIPEGGGKIFKDEGVVVTQPKAGEFKAFSSKCTHAGCAVSGITNGVITCPCHKSEFSVADGSVKKGPATQPLPAASIKVSGDSISLA
ncbi:Rieske (2Fe-2S) protein [Streptomyces graminilatus]|uniref:Rieske (2Fe-2S) protein n=1 Tax=Streptomyces graminilatus TaxID=1464070 RepID=UPI0006E3FD73|nr:Rieske (2Fe-2S) protein [Streptomyces graminilatus]